ncbi:Nif11-like leader peptide family natural product precursor [Cyanobium gracile UHCC 0139]|uniref:Nif11-like leader peptide family natural product n=1 Tax=Cyanobium gracile UHCC 0139 TaxID=3110308 RepID=A0ABU5RWL5_9CYAN|nr:Nif11-like leader peptide family natural product precursor [Cyanobium gracile]MEA5392170.1 Nif11-like leader peptide family natural product precursor [Cyanobium gracile UHCC 0139]
MDSGEAAEQEQLESFLAHAAASETLRVRLGGLDAYQVVAIAAEEGFQFGVTTLHRAVCTGYVMRRPR